MLLYKSASVLSWPDMQTVRSPWAKTFDSFVRSVRQRAIIVSPFITEEPLLRFISLLQGRTPPHVVLLTNLAPGSMLQGSLDTKAVAKFCKEFPKITVRHLPGLHAKSYVADEHTAIVTSGNLTSSSLFQNYEYGIQVDDPAAVRRIASTQSTWFQHLFKKTDNWVILLCGKCCWRGWR